MPAAAHSRYLLDLLSQVPDPRKRRGRRHSLASLLAVGIAVGIAVVIAGSRSFAAIGQWASDAGPEVLTVLGAARGAADESTFRRAFALVSADVLDRVLGAWLWTRAVQAGGRLVIAIDGKTVRGARNKGGRPRTWSRPWPTGSARSSRDDLAVIYNHEPYGPRSSAPPQPVAER
jgi:maltose-binding protein MalE